jgi:flagellar protein FlaJ
MAGKKVQGFTFFREYKKMLKIVKFRVPAEIWLAASTAVAVAVAVSIIALIFALELPISPLSALVAFLVVLDIMLGYPYLLAMKRVNAIEDALPDALKQLADTLKAGGTYEYALREISTAEYGPLSQEIGDVLRKMEEGENLEDSLSGFARNVDSMLVRRTVAIINDAIKAGAGLADILDEIADDVRAMHRIGRERISGTMLQVIFIVAAGSFVAPAIMGMSTTVVEMLIASSAGLVKNKFELVAAISAKESIVTLMQIYLIIEVVASGAMIALTREGKISKSLIYIPILLLIAFVCYYTALFASGLMIGGMT